MLHFVDGAVILISLLVVVGAVLRTVGKKRSGTEYFLAGRDLAWPFVGMSLFASNISAEHVIGMAGGGHPIRVVGGGYERGGGRGPSILLALFPPPYLRREKLSIPPVFVNWVL